ncbi:MAG TPA: nitroreductase family protein, partial [Anaerolineaceae bacterium]|nr:nitroreductase family protein [Anaerolineaceae bacterium]
VLLFLADYQRWMDYCIHCQVEERCREKDLPFRMPGPGDMLLAACDALIAAQTAVIAAESLGIGSCYIGDILEHYEEHRELFGLPRYTLPITLLCFGHPTSTAPLANPTPRYAEEFIVHQNAYRRFGAEELDRMAQPMVERYFANGNFFGDAQNLGQHYYFRKFIADFSIEMDRSAREMLKNWE